MQRVQQLGDRLLALRQVALGLGPRLAQAGVGQRQELLVVLGQRLGRELGEGAHEPGPVLLGLAGRLGLGRLEQVELGLGHGPPGLGRRPRRLGRGAPTRWHGPAGAACALERGPGVGQPPGVEPRRTGGAGRVHQVPRDADEQPRHEADDQSDDGSDAHDGHGTEGV